MSKKKEKLMTDKETTQARKFAVQLAKEVGKILIKNYKKIKTIDDKTSYEKVTNVDILAENKIIKAIKRRYPKHSILSEEAGYIKKDPDYMWVVDPLDGTHNYIYKLPLFGTSIALAYKKKPIMGVMYLPMINQMLYAEKGKGAYLNGKRIHVSKSTIKELLMVHDSTFHRKKDIQIQSISRLMDIVKRMRVLGCAISHFALVADGGADLYVERTIKPGDIAAGCLIVEEAGGKVTTLEGKHWNVFSKTILATNGKVHKITLDILK